MGDIEIGDSKHADSPLTKGHPVKGIVVEYNQLLIKTIEEMDEKLESYEVSKVVEEPIPNIFDGLTSFSSLVTWVSSIVVVFYISACTTTSTGSGIMILIGLELLLIGFAQFALLLMSNASSISAMVAQRWKAVSYIAIVMIVIFGISIATFLICIGAVQDGQTNNSQDLKTIWMPISIFFCLFILFVPLPVDKLPYQLEMVPLSGVLKSTHEFDFLAPHDEIKKSYVYRLNFFGLDPYWLTMGHYAAIGAGYLIGLVVECIQLVSYESDYAISILTIIYMIWAFIHAYLFLSGGGCCHCKLKNYATMACEVTFLLSHFVSMILFLVNKEGLIKIDLNS